MGNNILVLVLLYAVIGLIAITYHQRKEIREYDKLTRQATDLLTRKNNQLAQARTILNSVVGKPMMVAKAAATQKTNNYLN